MLGARAGEHAPSAHNVQRSGCIAVAEFACRPAHGQVTPLLDG
jgi:hypothetical protein